MKVPDLYVGKQLYVGIAVPPAIALGVGPLKVRGSAYIEGPILIGSPLSFLTAEAGLMVGRCTNLESKPLPISIFKVSSRGLAPTPLDVMLGDPTGPVGISCFCGPQPFIVQSASIELITTNYDLFAPFRVEVGASQDIGAKVFAGAKSETGVDSNLAFAYNAAPIIGDAPLQVPDYSSKITTLNSTFALVNTKKSFDIPHPTKEGYRLRYICLEGPEAEVYTRGKLINETIIELPEYWRELVDVETIGVTLTPIGSYQELFVEKIEWGTRITVKNNAGGAINCTYVAYGQRKDVTRNIPEYPGTTPNDYPGDNREYNINGL